MIPIINNWIIPIDDFNNTMFFIQEGKALLDGETLGETRADTQTKKDKPATKRMTTMQKTTAEGK